MNRIDAWWNRNFPPHSVARLLFFYAVIPITAFAFAQQRHIVELSFSWIDVFVASLSSAAVVTVAWFAGRSGHGRRAGAVDDSAEDTTWFKSPPARRLTLRDIGISWVILFIGVLALLYSMWPQDSDLMTFGLAVICTTFLIGLVATSFSLTLLVMGAAVISYPIAALLHLFFYFLSGNESIWGYWLFAFVMCLIGVLPIWGWVHSLKRARRWADLPLVFSSAGTSALLLIGALTVAGGDDLKLAATTGSEMSVREDVPAAAPVGASTPEMAVRQLLSAWRMGYEAGALRVADPHVVATLLEQGFDASLVLSGCSHLTCTLTSPEGESRVHLVKENHLYRVGNVESMVPPPAP